DGVRTSSATSDPGVLATVVPLCRDDAQLDAVLDAGATEVELDWMELVGLAKAVERARRRGARVGVATVRVQKPGEERIDMHLAGAERGERGAGADRARRAPVSARARTRDRRRGGGAVHRVHGARRRHRVAGGRRAPRRRTRTVRRHARNDALADRAALTSRLA